MGVFRNVAEYSHPQSAAFFWHPSSRSWAGWCGRAIDFDSTLTADDADELLTEVPTKSVEFFGNRYIDLSHFLGMEALIKAKV